MLYLMEAYKGEYHLMILDPHIMSTVMDQILS